MGALLVPLVSVMSERPFSRGVAPVSAWAPRAEELSGLRVVQAFPERPDRGTWVFFISSTGFVTGAVSLFRQSPVVADRKRRPPPQLGGACVAREVAAGEFPGSVVPCSAFCAVTPAGRRGCLPPSMFREEYIIVGWFACSGSCREETASFQVCARFRARSAPVLCFYLAPVSARAHFRAGIQ